MPHVLFRVIKGSTYDNLKMEVEYLDRKLAEISNYPVYSKSSVLFVTFDSFKGI